MKTPEQIARLFHDTYERLAPGIGWKTQARSAKPWDEVPIENRQLMVETVAVILPQLNAEWSAHVEAAIEALTWIGEHVDAEGCTAGVRLGDIQRFCLVAIARLRDDDRAAAPVGEQPGPTRFQPGEDVNTGAAPSTGGAPDDKCPKCFGDGMNHVADLAGRRQSLRCPHCGGTGRRTGATSEGGGR